MEGRTVQRFKNILLSDDVRVERKAALERAVALARRNQAQLTVVGIVEALPRELRMITVLNPSDLQEMVMEERREQLEHLIASIKHDDLQVTAKVLFGTPFLEIIREVLRNKHDLVMINAERKGRLNETLFGSTEMHLMRKCPCPVWVTKSTEPRQYERILAALDPDPSDHEKTALNSKIMDLATSLAHQEQSELHITHVWGFKFETLLRARRGLSPEEVDKVGATMRGIREQWLNELLEKYTLKDLNHQVHLLKGEPEKLIPELAKEKRIDVIVMGTVCRTGVEGFLIGNTAEKVLHQVDCSVLTVKPDRFVTPVIQLDRERQMRAA